MMMNKVKFFINVGILELSILVNFNVNKNDSPIYYKTPINEVRVTSTGHPYYISNDNLTSTTNLT